MDEDIEIRHFEGPVKNRLLDRNDIERFIHSKKVSMPSSIPFFHHSRQTYGVPLILVNKLVPNA